jgi:DNA-binding NtrC family response regulator
MARILIIDDEKAIRSTIREILEFEKYDVDEAIDGAEGLQKLMDKPYDVVLCDIKMPRMDGMEVLWKAKAEGLEAEFIMVSAHGTIETAVEATKKGAFDFIAKPPDLNRMLVTIRNATEKKALVKETTVLKQKVSISYEMIGASPALAEIKQMIERVAPTNARVLITGPNGSGKELVARELHKQSPRSGKALIEVNCAAIPSELIESELFGHEKGSFTSAYKQKIGKFELADGGTLFLDEVGDMSLAAQAKVLRALQEQKIARVGGDKEIKVDVRVLAATNKDLRKEIAAGNFREDLYHRLSVIVIQVPPLAERKDDIPELVGSFIKQTCQTYGIAPKMIEPEALRYLQSLSWPGNIRELKNVTERLIIMSDGPITTENARKYALAY